MEVSLETAAFKGVRRAPGWEGIPHEASCAGSMMRGKRRSKQCRRGSVPLRGRLNIMIINEPTLNMQGREGEGLVNRGMGRFDRVFLWSLY